jgi:nucleotide-binding universal stress UspA family protein
MFTNIAAAYDESPEARRSLTAAIHLAKALGARLQTITVMEGLPAYTAYGTAADASVKEVLEKDRSKFYEKLQADARAAAAKEGIEIVTNVIDGEEVGSIVNFVCEHNIDLIVIGIHRRESRLTRMWSTGFTVAQNVPCSVLGVH